MEQNIVKAKDVMQTNYTEIDGLSTVREAIDVFDKNNVQMLVVKKRDENDAYGVVLLSDIVKKVLAKNRASARVNVYEIMSKPAISVEPEMNVRYCARLFDSIGLSHVLVAEGGKVLGVIGYKELLKSWTDFEK